MQLSSNLKCLRYSARGQSMVEFAVAAPVLILILYMIMYVSDLYVIKSKTLVSARYGAWHLARGTAQQNNAPAKLGQTFHLKQGIKGKTVGVSAIAGDTGTAPLKLNHDSKTFVTPVDANTGGSTIGKITGGVNSLIVGGLEKLLGSESNSQTTALQVTFEASTLPMQLGPKLSKNLPKSFNIVGTHFVDGNSWNGCAVKVHDLLDMVFDQIGDGFIGVLRGKPEEEKGDPRKE